jgi:2-oxoglutarate/2-oxoacid ferredoxin oxidoreductase subunit alpha
MGMGNILNIVIGGEAGQGLVTIGELLAKSLVRGGYFIRVTQSYMSRIRGGHNTYTIRVGTEEILASQEPIDLLVALDKNTYLLHKQELSPGGSVAADKDFGLGDEACLHIPFKELGTGQYSNIVALGAVGAHLGLSEERLGRTVDDFFGRKDAEVAKENLRVLQEAFRWASALPPCLPKLPPIPNPPSRLMMNGNEAIALGAASAGLRFYSFYPMTPATSIAQTLAGCAQHAGLVVEQAEDEISAINMALGASYVGAPSMVGTSGGGFALMVEGVSLAGMTETPVVIVVAQRPGPATGLPTRTEQGDLNFVLHAGHGEFPRAILAPGTVEECFHLTRQAFFLAEKYQGPIFILTDHFLADSASAIEPFALNRLESIRPGAGTSPMILPYRRFALTESGISPRLLPGSSKHLVVAGSDEHTEDGHLTEDLAVRKKMVEKRLRKSEGLSKEATPPEFKGERNPDLLLVSWGSSKGSVQEAAGKMKSSGKRVGTLHFSQVWPLVPDPFLAYLREAREVVCVESNATGQLAGLIRRETGFEIKRQIHRYDGLPLTPEFILRELR